jgi:uncharacterized protein (TIGR03643 family)
VKRFLIVEIKRKVKLKKLKTETKNIFKDLSEVDIGTIIEMALSDHTSFSEIQLQYGLKEDQVKELMRKNLKKGSYRSWRKRVKTFSDRREFYK